MVSGSTQITQAREQALILAVRAGADALGVLYGMHRSAALGFARSLTKDAHDAEEILHEAFTKTMNAIRNGNGPTDNFLAYLNAAIRGTAAGWWKRSSREVPVETINLEQAADYDPRLEAITDRDGNERIFTALRSLPERWQTALCYADVLQEKPRNIAPLVGRTERRLRTGPPRPPGSPRSLRRDPSSPHRNTPASTGHIAV
jgi:RNA polymerase sigma factor (sigma-70 family)